MQLNKSNSMFGSLFSTQSKIELRVTLVSYLSFSELKLVEIHLKISEKLHINRVIVYMYLSYHNM